MADIEFIVPGSGIIDDTQKGSEIIIPGAGIYVEQEAAAPGGIIGSRFLGSNIFPTVQMFKGGNL